MESDGSVVTWGASDSGGDNSTVQNQLEGVQQVQAASHAFAAILADGDGSVVTWGLSRSGGGSSEVQDQLKGVEQVQGTFQAFVAILADGSVVTWGTAHAGGESSEVQSQFKGVQLVQATAKAFAAILADGSVVTWGAGGPLVKIRLKSEQHTGKAFVLTSRPFIVTWACEARGHHNCPILITFRCVDGPLVPSH